MPKPGTKEEEYSVDTCMPGDLSEPEIVACIGVIRDGGAVAVDKAKLRKSKLLAVAWKADEIVGVGSLKCVRADYFGH